MLLQYGLNRVQALFDAGKGRGVGGHGVSD
jgi:hypothetical protein